jgi:hypothetical protein
MFRHNVEDAIILPPGIDKHAPPVVGNDGRICRRRCSYLVHARSIDAANSAFRVSGHPLKVWRLQFFDRAKCIGASSEWMLLRGNV